MYLNCTKDLPKVTTDYNLAEFITEILQQKQEQ